MGTGADTDAGTGAGRRRASKAVVFIRGVSWSRRWGGNGLAADSADVPVPSGRPACKKLALPGTTRCAPGVRTRAPLPATVQPGTTVRTLTPTRELPQGVRGSRDSSRGRIVIFVALGSPVELWGGDRQFSLGSVKQRCVLAVLLHARGEPVVAETLIERVWGDDAAPTVTRATLQTYVSRLRGVLKKAVGDRARIDHRAPGLYRLLVDEEEVDLCRFQRLRKDAAEAAARGERQMAVGLLATAESMWRGEPFAEFTSDWGRAVRARLHEDLRAVREERIKLALDRGEHADLLGELHQLASEYPTGQRIVGLLMTALYRCGRTEEALDHYHLARRRLRERLGIEPGAELRDLHQRILEEDRSLLVHEAAPARSSADRGASRDARPRNNLPRDTRDFTGRERELSLLIDGQGTTGMPGPTCTPGPTDAPGPAGAQDSLPGQDPANGQGTRGRQDPSGGPGPSRMPGQPGGRSARPAGGGATPWITVVHGMPGIGKTALAVHAAHRLAPRYPDGAFYVDLRGYSDQPSCEPFDALGLLLSDADVCYDPESVSLDERTRRWREWTSRHAALLVLDNARDVRQVAPLLPAAAGNRAIVTSRKRLHALQGADHLALDALPERDAVALFARVVGTARAPESAALHSAVGRFGGHPLSLTLLASGFKHRETWDLQYLAERLEQAADPLDEVDDDLVGSAFRLSYEDLGDAAQCLFRRCSLHPGPDLSETAAVVLGGLDEAAGRRALRTLLDHHLLDERLRDRYALHDLARAFGRRVCEEEDTAHERRDAFDRLVAYYLTAADRADRAAHPRRRRLPLPPASRSPYAPHFADAEEASAWLAVERPNLLAVAREALRCTPGTAALFPHVLAQALKLWAVWGTAAELHSGAVRALRKRDDKRALAQALSEWADVVAQEDHERAMECATEAAALFAEAGDAHGCATARLQTGRAWLAAGQHAKALEDLAVSLRLFRACGDEYGEAEALNVEGVALHYAGRFQDALGRFRRVFDLHARADDAFGEATALNNIGLISFLEGRYSEARHHFQEALVRAQLVGGPLDIALEEGNIGAVYQAMGDTERAVACFERALASYRKSGDSAGEADTLIHLGSACAETGRFDEAVGHVRSAEQVAREVGNVYECQRAMTALGEVWRLSGRTEAARQVYEEALAMARDIDFPLGIAHALDGLARTALLSGRPGQARRLGEEALALYAELDVTTEARALRLALREERAAGG
nr:tetratricopeptide repeat protein [Streptomyces albus]